MAANEKEHPSSSNRSAMYTSSFVVGYWSTGTSVAGVADIASLRPLSYLVSVPFIRDDGSRYSGIISLCIDVAWLVCAACTDNFTFRNQISLGNFHVSLPRFANISSCERSSRAARTGRSAGRTLIGRLGTSSLVTIIRPFETKRKKAQITLIIFLHVFYYFI